MKIVIGCGIYGFEIPDEIYSNYESMRLTIQQVESMARISPEMIEYAENAIVNNPETEYSIVSIPDEIVTDWYVHEWEGDESDEETVIAVIDGHIYSVTENLKDRFDNNKVGFTQFLQMSTGKRFRFSSKLEEIKECGGPQ